ncbi:MAG: transposase [Saprospiraceae bacterium]|nr:transposase [Saprospiraceae bacterium]
MTAYNHYLQFAKFTERSILYVIEKMQYDTLNKHILKSWARRNTESQKKNTSIDIQENGEGKTLCLRKETYRDEKGRVYEFITNNFEIKREEVAYIYKLRWNIELLFKKLKQNFQLHFFYSETENGIKTQIWCTLIAQLLLLVLK